VPVVRKCACQTSSVAIGQWNLSGVGSINLQQVHRLPTELDGCDGCAALPLLAQRDTCAGDFLWLYVYQHEIWRLACFNSSTSEASHSQKPFLLIKPVGIADSDPALKDFFHQVTAFLRIITASCHRNERNPRNVVYRSSVGRHSLGK